MFTSYSKETSRSFCVCMLEEHQSSVEASPGGGDAFLCCCSSVLCSEDPQLARTDHPLLWYIWTLLPSISLSLPCLAETNWYRSWNQVLCVEYSRWSAEDSVPGWSPEWTSGSQLLIGRSADAQWLQDVERYTHTICSGFEPVFIKMLKNFDTFVTAGARNIYHQLLMNSLLMDLKYKKIFAVQFAKVIHLINTCYCIPPVLATKLSHQLLLLSPIRQPVCLITNQ